jgi:hypothetical protein
MAEIVSTLSTEPRPASGSNGANARPVISQTVTVGSLARATPVPAAGDGSGGAANTIANEVKQGGGAVRSSLGETARAMIAALDKPAATAAAVAPATPAVVVPEPVAGGAAPAPAAAPAQPAAPAQAGDQRSELERYVTRNRDLVAENERLKSGGAKREPSAREKALDEAEASYFSGRDGAVGAVRRMLATWLGVDDPKHADVDHELKGLYQDLTAKELGIEPEDAQQAKREAVRTRQMLERETRQRKAAQETTRPAEDPAAKVDADHTSIIATRLASVGDAHPLTMELAEEFYGLKPEALLLRVIRDGFATGEFDPKDKNETLIAQALEKTEPHFQARADKIAAATTRTAPPNPSDPIAKKDDGQQQAARTITNASASVAPATPPAKPVVPERQQYRSEDARRRAILEKHAGGR